MNISLKSALVIIIISFISCDSDQEQRNCIKYEAYEGEWIWAYSTGEIYDDNGDYIGIISPETENYNRRLIIDKYKYTEVSTRFFPDTILIASTYCLEQYAYPSIEKTHHSLFINTLYGYNLLVSENNDTLTIKETGISHSPREYFVKK